MRKALHIRTTALPGGKIEIVEQGLPVGESVDVVVSQLPASERRSADDILDETPEHLSRQPRTWLRTSSMNGLRGTARAGIQQERSPRYGVEMLHLSKRSSTLNLSAPQFETV